MLTKFDTTFFNIICEEDQEYNLNFNETNNFKYVNENLAMVPRKF